MNNDMEGLTGLVQRAQVGDRVALNKMVRWLQGQAICYAFHLLRSCPEAEDAEQDAFVQFGSELPRLRDPRAVEIYLSRMVFKYCGRRRRAQSFQMVSLGDVGGLAAGGEPFVMLLRREQRNKGGACAHAPPLFLQQITRLRYECGLSPIEITEQAALPVSTVKNRCTSPASSYERSYGKGLTYAEVRVMWVACHKSKGEARSYYGTSMAGGERHNLAHHFSMSGLYADASPFWEKYARTGEH